MTKIILDLNEPEFQNEFFELQKDEQRALLNTFKKISNLSWDDKSIKNNYTLCF